MILAFNVSFEDLYSASGISCLDQIFLQFLNQHDLECYQNLKSLRTLETSLKAKEQSQFILKLAFWIEKFLIQLFQLESAFETLKKRAQNNSLIAEIRKQFIQKQVARRYSPLECQQFDLREIEYLIGPVEDDFDFAQKVMKWLRQGQIYQQQIQAAVHYAAWAIYTAEGQKKHRHSVLFKIPQKLDFNNLINNQDEKYERSDFNHYASCFSSTHSMREAHYCLYCHHQDKDSCSKGLYEKNSLDFQINPLGNVLTGCPLNQKISEMNLMYAKRSIIGALAIITLDNPMVAATGYRICNDCSKACIFQKQEPVDIPGIETRLLQEVLALPWGFEIYSLLTRWNPLNIRQPIPKSSSGYRVLIAGLGPAGFTLAHYLLNQGHEVLAIDGQKIEPLPDKILNLPIFSIQDILRPLEERVIGGFGGVAEYGITARWDKNNLTLIRLLLERRPNFKYQSETRLGSQLTLESAFNLGFDHVALCTGAGRPKFLDIPNRFAPGVYMAADFLMALHLQGLYREESLATFRMQGPILVIGGGLTAIDAATEALTYCRQQNKKRDCFSTLDTKIIYRRCLQESPAYRLNHAEVQQALNQGIEFCEQALPLEILIDDQGQVAGLKVNQLGEIRIFKAKTILIATGTSHSESNQEDPRVSILGDQDNQFAGSVVKAMASAKEKAPYITHQMQIHQNKQNQYKFSLSQIQKKLIATVVQTYPIADKLQKLVIQAPVAVRAWQPGQFFRLQNFAVTAPYFQDKPLLMKGVALRPSWVDVEREELTFIISEVGASTYLCSSFKKGEKISLMGPVGTPIDLPSHQKVFLIGEAGSAPALLPIMKVLRNNNNQVTLMTNDEIAYGFYQDHFKKVIDQIIWYRGEDTSFLQQKSPDFIEQKSIIDSLLFHAQSRKIDLQQIDSILVTGSPNFMKSFQQARFTTLKDFFNPMHKIVGLINSRMQCMMQICGQCIQSYKDPITGKEKIFFACIDQIQPLDVLDFDNLTQRLNYHHLEEAEKYKLVQFHS